ncbi:MAG: type IV pilus twitching motility protein PilT [Armatimonadetes bacterium]|nr:type IV pilus twitching motility protein PilT [Armatimonadota bacterium]
MAQNPAQIGRPVAPGALAPRPLGARPLAPQNLPLDGNGANGNGFTPIEAPTEVPVEVVEKVPLDEVHIDELLQLVLDTKGSDLHLAVAKPPCIRVHGKVKEVSSYESFRPAVIQRVIYDILSDEQIQRFENDLELDFAYTTSDGAARFRVNAFKDKGALAAAMRVIPTKIPDPEELGLPAVIMEQANRPRGLMLVTGPTGSGKSTTLAAVLNKINMEHEGHILTIEDPIEFVHQHKKCVVNQREVGTDTRSFKNALRAALREDPDVILVGEMRDTETIHLAVTAAETGHLVFGTLHTNSAAESIDRMVGVFPADQQEQVRTQLSNSLVAIVTQQLLPKIGGGRISAMEIMIANSAIRNLIREAKAHQMNSIIQTQNGIGMQTMDQALRDLVLNGQVDYETAMSRAHNPAELEVMIQGGMNTNSDGR